MAAYCRFLGRNVPDPVDPSRRSRSGISLRVDTAQERPNSVDTLRSRVRTRWGCSSAGQSVCVACRRPWVRVPSAPLPLRTPTVHDHRRSPRVPNQARLLDGACRRWPRDPDHAPRPPLRPPRPSGSAARHHRYLSGRRASNGPGGDLLPVLLILLRERRQPGRTLISTRGSPPFRVPAPRPVPPSRLSTDPPSAPPADPFAGIRTRAGSAADFGFRSIALQIRPSATAKVTGSTLGAPSSSRKPSLPTRSVSSKVFAHATKPVD